jgi:alkanesulfonate monooxygenase SsuD/methylene tetrahydromethanopterin reductase-like flavin-dependent oxidoreductase (luciferase family)
MPSKGHRAMNEDHRPLAVAVMPLETRREAILHLATTADRLGYHTLFLPETWSHDVTVVLAEAATCTGNIRLGSAVLGIWGRSAATIAMAASTLDTLSKGRFTLGLGVSTAQLTEGLHDVPFDVPTAKLRQVVLQIRALLNGDRAPLFVTPQARQLRLNLPTKPELPIYVAGLASKTVRLTGELADGWLPFLFARDQLADGMSLLEKGMAQRTNSGQRPRVCPVIPAVVAEDPEESRRGAAWFVAFYLTSMGPFYAAALKRQGFVKEVDVVLAANTARGSAVVPPEADALLEQLTIFGTPEEARARLVRWRECGADLPIVMLRPNLTNEQIDFELEALCAEPAASRLPTSRPAPSVAERTTLGVGEAVI